MKRLAWLFVSLVCLTGQADDKERTWTSVEGRTMQAQFIREVDGDVTFLKDGKLTTIPLDRLSEQDQKLIRELEAAKKLDETIPPAGAPRREPPTNSDDTTSPTETRPAGDAKPSLGNKKASAETRTWRDSKGKQTTAKFIRIHDGNVILLRAGRTVSMPLSSLSREDQQYVRDLLAGRGEEQLVPPPVADSDLPMPTVAVAEAPGPPPPVAPAGPEPKIAGRTPLHEQMQKRLAGQTQSQANDSQPEREKAPQQTAQNDQQNADQPQPVVQEPQVTPKAARLQRLKFDNPQQIVAFFIGLPILAAIVSLIGAIILRAAIYWVTGEHLPYGDAYGTFFLMYIANGFLGFLFALATGNLIESDETANLLSLLAIPIGFLVQSAIISGRLETSFGTACLVSLMMLVVMLVIVIGICAIGFGFFGVMRLTS